MREILRQKGAIANLLQSLISLRPVGAPVPSLIAPRHLFYVAPREEPYVAGPSSTQSTEGFRHPLEPQHSSQQPCYIASGNGHWHAVGQHHQHQHPNHQPALVQHHHYLSHPPQPQCASSAAQQSTSTGHAMGDKSTRPAVDQCAWSAAEQLTSTRHAIKIKSRRFGFDRCAWSAAQQPGSGLSAFKACTGLTPSPQQRHYHHKQHIQHHHHQPHPPRPPRAWSVAQQPTSSRRIFDQRADQSAAQQPGLPPPAEQRHHHHHQQHRYCHQQHQKYTERLQAAAPSPPSLGACQLHPHRTIAPHQPPQTPPRKAHTPHPAHTPSPPHPHQSLHVHPERPHHHHRSHPHPHHKAKPGPDSWALREEESLPVMQPTYPLSTSSTTHPKPQPQPQPQPRSELPRHQHRHPQHKGGRVAEEDQQRPRSPTACQPDLTHAHPRVRGAAAPHRLLPEVAIACGLLPLRYAPSSLTAAIQAGPSDVHPQAKMIQGKGGLQSI
ncbi:hypothetical protein DUNSADRAFT_17049 [Dunaliella salina]|uniref:Uncharacterized protein n=1 Tax=Dunaliella salina TaxID=3046 RepID=A0ABQ7H0H6_DUNSA|nr:hypothetical protein DUNSADRAFT_17049 [Dunaliella salina]|eukprot:KAF5840352.1 hypothetical protein DUNSADRAFT_17049 [Dunaliella salina]